jgi:hypothetical protein
MTNRISQSSKASNAESRSGDEANDLKYREYICHDRPDSVLDECMKLRSMRSTQEVNLLSFQVGSVHLATRSRRA